jgi:hypothetical protein
MTSKISPSIVGEKLRVRDSVHPVHSWKESQITDGLLAFSSAAAMAGAIVGGRAIMEAVAAQNFKKPRRDTPRSRKLSPRVL